MNFHLFENLLVINNGEVIKTIVSDLENLIYNVSFSLLNTTNFGLAQNRERVYIVCVNKTKFSNVSFNFTNLKNINVRKNLKDTNKNSRSISKIFFNFFYHFISVNYV